VTAENHIDAEAAKLYQDQLDEAAVVYSTSKTHTVAYRGTLTKLFVDLTDGIKGFFNNFLDSFLTKLLSFNPLSPIGTIIDGFTDVLSALILKAGYILDILYETSKSIVYGTEHLGSVIAGQAGKLLKSDQFQNDLKILATVVPATIATLLAVQGGLAFILANLITVKTTNIITLLAQFSVDLLPTGNILTSWQKLADTSTQQQVTLAAILDDIRKTASAA